MSIDIWRAWITIRANIGDVDMIGLDWLISHYDVAPKGEVERLQGLVDDAAPVILANVDQMDADGKTITVLREAVKRASIAFTWWQATGFPDVLDEEEMQRRYDCFHSYVTAHHLLDEEKP